MNVVGFRSRTRRKSISASASRPSNLREKSVAEGLRARRSTSSKPILWRVPSYLLPGLPRPTTSFLMTGLGPRPGSLLLLLVLLADQLRLGRRTLGPLGRGRGGLSQDDVDEDQ